jgi:hypothetical protein
MARASAARPARCTNTGAHDGVELDQLGERRRHAGRQHEPAEAPAGHEEALREAVDDDQAIVAWAMSRKLGADAAGSPAKKIRS